MTAIADYKKFVPLVNMGISHSDPDYGRPGAKAKQFEFFHSQIRTIETTVIYSTWFGSNFGMLSFFNPDTSLSNMLVDIRVMQAWWGLYNTCERSYAQAEVARHGDVPWDAFDVALSLPVIDLYDGEITRLELGIVDDVLESVKLVLMQPDLMRFVSVTDENCVSCKREVGINSHDLGGINDNAWVPVEVGEAGAYAPMCEPCESAAAQDYVEHMLGVL